MTNLRRRIRADPPDLALEEYAGDVASLLTGGAQQGDGIRGLLSGLDEGLHGLGRRHWRDSPEDGAKRKQPPEVEDGEAADEDLLDLGGCRRETAPHAGQPRRQHADSWQERHRTKR